MFEIPCMIGWVKKNIIDTGVIIIPRRFAATNSFNMQNTYYYYIIIIIIIPRRFAATNSFNMQNTWIEGRKTTTWAAVPREHESGNSGTNLFFAVTTAE